METFEMKIIQILLYIGVPGPISQGLEPFQPEIKSLERRCGVPWRIETQQGGMKMTLKSTKMT